MHVKEKKIGGKNAGKKEKDVVETQASLRGLICPL